MERENINFPKDFLWGTAVSAYQVEGNNPHNDWANCNGKVQQAGYACDFYRRYPEDLRLATKLGNNAIRCSLEWSRLQPESPRQFSENELDHYKRMLETIHELGLYSVLTLHHFTNPIWFAKKGGWVRKENIPYFTEYVQKCKDALNPDVWVTINEAGVYAERGFAAGDWPPFKRNIPLALRVYSNMARAHNEAYRTLSSSPQPIGSAVHMTDVRVTPPTVERLIWRALNHSFLDLTKGSYDYVGINYYHPFYIDKRKIPENMSVDDSGWLNDPNGLEKVIMATWQRYGKPIYITENGIDDRKGNKREEFIRTHVEAMQHAIAKGADVKGYFYWSLLNNFEWRDGFDPRYGLHAIGPNQERIPQPGASAYADICFKNRNGL